MSINTLHCGISPVKYSTDCAEPDNALWMLQTQNWKLIDFGIAAQTGALAHVQDICHLAPAVSAHGMPVVSAYMAFHCI